MKIPAKSSNVIMKIAPGNKISCNIANNLIDLGTLLILAGSSKWFDHVRVFREDSLDSWFFIFITREQNSAAVGSGMYRIRKWQTSIYLWIYKACCIYQFCTV
ncbi:hypothetical protein S83_013590 [Arachis hypogaea]